MNSVDYFGTVFSNVIKASQAAKSAFELSVDLESQAAQIFNAMQQEISEMEKQSRMDKERISELEAEVESLKSKAASPSSVEPEVL